jgi:adenylate cyclase
MRLSPRNPQAYSDYLALALFGAGRYEEALKAFQTAPDPSFYYHAWLAACYVRIGDLDKARFHGAKSTELAPNFTISRFVAMEPIRNPADMANWRDALQQAGIRE